MKQGNWKCKNTNLCVLGLISTGLTFVSDHYCLHRQFMTLHQIAAKMLPILPITINNNMELNRWELYFLAK